MGFILFSYTILWYSVGTVTHTIQPYFDTQKWMRIIKDLCFNGCFHTISYMLCQKRPSGHVHHCYSYSPQKTHCPCTLCGCDEDDEKKYCILECWLFLCHRTTMYDDDNECPNKLSYCPYNTFIWRKILKWRHLIRFTVYLGVLIFEPQLQGAPECQWCALRTTKSDSNKL